MDVLKPFFDISLVSESKKRSRTNSLSFFDIPNRRREPANDEEEEILDNAVDAVCAVLTNKEMQSEFVKVHAHAL